MIITISKDKLSIIIYEVVVLMDLESKKIFAA